MHAITRAEANVISNSDMKLLLAGLIALRQGDTSFRLPEEWTGLPGKIADVFNDVVSLNDRMTQELGHLSRVVGKEGKLKQRGSLGEVGGCWRVSIDSVNALIR